MAVNNLLTYIGAIYNFFIHEVLLGFSRLHFRRTAPKFRPLPPHITRRYIPGPAGSEGELELLVCEPKNLDPSKRPLLFVHGCFGHASVWLNWISYLHSHNYGGPMYAISLRGHGGSWLPSSYFRMVWRTTHEDMAQDLLAGIQSVTSAQTASSEQPILIGHSAGGELVQSLLSTNRTTCHALALVGGIPHYGADPAFDNWANLDPVVNLRLMLHLLHPKSNISSPHLMQRAYFSPNTPISLVQEFGKWSPDYEAMWWPFVTLGKKDSNGVFQHLDPLTIVPNIGDPTGTGDRVLVLNGASDALIAGTADRVVADYRQAFVKLRGRSTAAADRGSDGVALVEIDGAGHHVQNDVQWEEGAKALLGWLSRV